MTSPEEQRMFLNHIVSNSLRDFDGWLQDNLKLFYHEFFIIESDEGEVMGFVYSYDKHLQDGHCKIAMYIVPAWRNSGISAMAVFQFIDYLFRYYPLRRINCDVYNYNAESLRNIKQFGFESTGCLKEYRFYDGAYHDLELFSITRDYFMEHWKNLLVSHAKEEAN